MKSLVWIDAQYDGGKRKTSVNRSASDAPGAQATDRNFKASGEAARVGVKGARGRLDLCTHRACAASAAL
jgi:hypothetical protein